MRFISRVVGFGHRSVVFGSIFSLTRGAVIGCRNPSVVFGFIFSTTRRRRVGCGDPNVVLELISSKGGVVILPFQPMEQFLLDFFFLPFLLEEVLEHSDTQQQNRRWRLARPQKLWS